MSDHFVAVLVSVPGEHFSDDDDICLAAGNFVCARLEPHLVQSGHTIADWIKGGCDEDWGVYFESQHGDETFDFHICFFPGPSDDGESQMMIQYHPKIAFLKRLFRKPRELGPSHHMHATMRTFGETFHSSRMLTQSQFDSEY